ncbi:MAG: hypothetical protein A2Y25_05190 [Candidatus Melainabacteria bacterium GWF2_37_15]|nr:MAG: hypothetical protein A2Y25_05190 [Candidatus Melainabacteria bacterium GWF2_37_15]
MLNSVNSNVFRSANVQNLRNPAFGGSNLSIPKGTSWDLDAIADEVLIRGVAAKNVEAKDAMIFEGGQVEGSVYAEDAVHNFGVIGEDMIAGYAENRGRVKNVTGNTVINSGEIDGDIDASKIELREVSNRIKGTGVKESKVAGDVIIDNIDGKGSVRITNKDVKVDGSFIFKGKKGVVECPKEMADSLRIVNGKAKPLNIII